MPLGIANLADYSSARISDCHRLIVLTIAVYASLRPRSVSAISPGYTQFLAQLQSLLTIGESVVAVAHRQVHAGNIVANIATHTFDHPSRRWICKACL